MSRSVSVSRCIGLPVAEEYSVTPGADLLRETATNSLGKLADAAAVVVAGPVLDADVVADVAEPAVVVDAESAGARPGAVVECEPPDPPHAVSPRAATA